MQRDGELAAIRRGLDSVRAGQGRVMAVTGSPGIGKSALLDEVRAEAEARGGWLCLSAAGSRLTAHTQYGLFGRLFADLAGFQADDPAPFDDPGALLLRAIRDREPVDPPVLAHAVSRVLSSLAARSRVLILVDDLQWADEASAAVLGHLVATVPAQPIALLFGLVDQAPDARSGLANAVITLARPLVGLRPLTLASVAAMVGAAGADPVTVHQLSGGVPAYAAELISHPDAGGDSLVPERVVEAVSQRLRGLGPADTAVARAVSVLSANAGASVVAEVAGVRRSQLDVSIDPLVAAGVLDRPRLAGGATLRMSCPLVAAAILDAIGPLATAALHKRAARVLARHGAPAQLIAEHLTAADAGEHPWRIRRSVSALSAAERRVAELAAQGRRNAEIARELFVSQKTVEFHLSRTYRKLGIAGKAQLSDRLIAEAVDACFGDEAAPAALGY